MADSTPLSEADFARARRAVELGWVTHEQVEAALMARDREPGSRLLNHLSLSPHQFVELENFQPDAATVLRGDRRSQKPELPEEVAEAMRNPKLMMGGYVLARFLGKGGFKEVYQAWQLQPGRWVALARLIRGGDEEERAAFLIEARLAANLDHPHIAKIYEVGEAGGELFVAMQFIDGKTLHQVKGDLPLESKIDAVTKIAKAVSFAHGKNVIHRDLKPANVMVDRDGQVFVMDFGLAKKTAPGDKSLSQTSAAVGSPPWMAPEQALGKASAQSDVYGVGAILYDMVTGRPPFTGETGTDIIFQVVNREPVWPRKLSPTTPEDVQAIILHALEKDKKRRYADANQLIQDLEAFAQKEPLRHARRPTLAYVLAKKVRKQPLLWAAVLGMVIAILGGGAFGTIQLLRARSANLVALSAAENRARIEKESRERIEREHDKTTAARLRAEAGELDAKTKLSYSYVLRGRRASEAGDSAAAAVFYSAAFVAHQSELTHALAAYPPEDAVSRRAILVHPHKVFGVVFSPDGRLVATGCADRSVRLWDADTGEDVGKAIRHEASVAAVAFRPDGKRVATGCFDYAARLWDAMSGEAIGKPMRHGSFVLAVAFSPDGRRLVTGSEDGTARIWDAETGDPVGKELRHRSSVHVLAFSPDGRRVATGSRDRAAQVWNVETGESIGKPMRHGGDVVFVAFTPDGRRVMTGSEDKTRPDRAEFEDKVARIWDAETGESIGREMRHEGDITSLAFSPDGTRVATGSGDRTARLWDAATGKGIGRVMWHEDRVLSIAFSPDGKRVATKSGDRTVVVWDVEGGERIEKVIRHSSRVNAVTFSPDGRRVLTASRDKTARFWDAATGEPVGKTMCHESSVEAAAFSPDGRRAVTGSNDKTARLWDAATGDPIGMAMRHDSDVVSVAFSPDGRRVTTGTLANSIRFWDAETGGPVGNPLRFESDVSHMALSPDFKRVATGTQHGGVRLWEAETAGELGKVTGHEDWIVALAFSPDGKKVATAGYDKRARLWDATTGAEIGKAMDHEDWVIAVAFSPDGKRVLTGSRDHTARLWDAATGEAVGKAMRHERAVAALAFGPDGKRVLTGSWDNTARLWDAATGEPVGKIMRHEDEVRVVAFSPDGNRVATGSLDRSARLWDVSFLHDETAPDVLQLRVQVRTGVRLGRTDEIETISAGEWRELKRKLDEMERPK